MNENVFNGSTAWFSEGVSQARQKEWRLHGGKVTRSVSDANYIFSDDSNDSETKRAFDSLYGADVILKSTWIRQVLNNPDDDNISWHGIQKFVLLPKSDQKVMTTIPMKIVSTVDTADGKKISKRLLVAHSTVKPSSTRQMFIEWSLDNQSSDDEVITRKKRIKSPRKMILSTDSDENDCPVEGKQRRKYTLRNHTPRSISSSQAYSFRKRTPIVNADTKINLTQDSADVEMVKQPKQRTKPKLFDSLNKKVNLIIKNQESRISDMTEQQSLFDASAITSHPMIPKKSLSSRQTFGESDQDSQDSDDEVRMREKSIKLPQKMNSDTDSDDKDSTVEDEQKGKYYSVPRHTPISQAYLFRKRRQISFIDLSQDVEAMKSAKRRMETKFCDSVNKIGIKKKIEIRISDMEQQMLRDTGAVANQTQVTKAMILESSVSKKTVSKETMLSEDSAVATSSRKVVLKPSTPSRKLTKKLSTQKRLETTNSSTTSAVVKESSIQRHTSTFKNDKPLISRAGSSRYMASDSSEDNQITDDDETECDQIESNKTSSIKCSHCVVLMTALVRTVSPVPPGPDRRKIRKSSIVATRRTRSSKTEESENSKVKPLSSRQMVGESSQDSQISDDEVIMRKKSIKSPRKMILDTDSEESDSTVESKQNCYSFRKRPPVVYVDLTQD